MDLEGPVCVDQCQQVLSQYLTIDRREDATAGP